MRAGRKKEASWSDKPLVSAAAARRAADLVSKTKETSAAATAQHVQIAPRPNASGGRTGAGIAAVQKGGNVVRKTEVATAIH